MRSFCINFLIAFLGISPELIREYWYFFSLGKIIFVFFDYCIATDWQVELWYWKSLAFCDKMRKKIVFEYYDTPESFSVFILVKHG